MSRRRRILIASVAGMALISLGGAGVTIPTLYRAAFEAERLRLQEVVRSHAAFIEAVTQFDAVASRVAESLPGKPGPPAGSAAVQGSARLEQSRFSATRPVISRLAATGVR